MTKKYRRFRNIIPFLFIFSLLLGVQAESAETWTLTFSGEGFYHKENFVLRVDYTGNATIVVNKDGSISGNGTISIDHDAIGPGVGTYLEGSGTCYISGEYDKKYLTFYFQDRPILLKGYTKVYEEIKKAEGYFEPTSIAEEDFAAMIERKNGATTTHKIETDMFTIKTDFALSGSGKSGNEKEIKKDDYFEIDNIWILELEAKWKMVTPLGTSECETNGSVELHLPSDEGPVEAEGPLYMNYDGNKGKGTLIFEGFVKDGMLTCFPRSSIQEMNIGGSVQKYKTGSTSDDRVDTFSIPIENGAEITFPVTGGEPYATTTGFARYRLKGVKREIWRVTIDDYRIEYLVHGGAGPGPKNKRAGLKVHARRIIDVIIDNGKFKRGEGIASFVSIKSYSNPPWAYTCKATTQEIIGTGSDIEAERVDQVHWTKRFNPPKNKADSLLKGQWEKIRKNKTPYIYPETFSVSGKKSGSKLALALPKNSGYTVGIYCKLNEEEVKKHGFTVGAKALKEAMGLEQTVLESKFTVTLSDGWSYEDAPPEALDRTIITVNRIK